MKKNNVIAYLASFEAIKHSVLIVVGVVIGMVMCASWHHHNVVLVHAYEKYYNATEDFLDTLAQYDNWPDRFDPMEYYDAHKELVDIKGER